MELSLNTTTFPQDVYTTLSNLKRAKATGPDNLPSWVLKELALEILHPLLIFLMRQSKRERLFLPMERRRLQSYS